MRREDRSSIVVSILSQTSAGKGVGYVIDRSSLRPVPLFVPGGRSFVPACARGRTARGSGRSGRGLLRLDALEGASLVENRPGDPGELVGERNRQHVVVQSFLGGFNLRFEAIALPTLYPDQHNPRGLHEQRAQVAIAAP